MTARVGMAGAQVKEYLERQWHKILANRVSVQDFVFAKEVRLGTYSPKAAVVPPAAIVAAKAMATDPRAEPRFAERVPYVVVYGEPGMLRYSKQNVSCLVRRLVCKDLHFATGQGCSVLHADCEDKSMRMDICL